MLKFVGELTFYSVIFAFVVVVITFSWEVFPSYPKEVMEAGRWIVASGIVTCMLYNRRTIE